MNNWREILGWREFEFEVLREGDPRIEKTLYGYFLNQIVVSYERLLEVLGPPTYPNGDGYKTDAEWVIYFPDIDDVMTIYNYRTGKNYLGEGGKNKEDINIWHVSGHHNVYIDKIYELLMVEK